MRCIRDESQMESPGTGAVRGSAAIRAKLARQEGLRGGGKLIRQVD